MSISDYEITGNALYLNKVFCSDYEFIIPSYQRPYSWEEEHIQQLFNDLYESYERKDETYFLGSIVIEKDKSSKLAYIVDGQQRLTSLTILLSALIYLFNNENYKLKASRYIIQENERIGSNEYKARLILRKQDNAFFKSYIQEFNFEDAISLDIDKNCKNEAQKNIILNARATIRCINDKLKTEDDIINYFNFIIEKCCLIIVSTKNRNSAFRIFSVMNNRGLDLLPTDILKADLIGKIDAHEQEYYTKIWEDLEQELGRNRFNELFTHLRMIKLKVKSQKTVLEEIQTHIISKLESKPALIKDFIERELVNYSDNLNMIKNKTVRTDKQSESVNDLLFWLNKVNFSEWIPVALLFLNKSQNGEQMLNFFTKLECLTSYLFLSAKNVNDRIKRYAEILYELDKNNLSPKEIDLTDKEKLDFKDILNGNIYEMIISRRNYLILRTDRFISDKNATYKGSLTIEHVLPQTVKENSQWASWWNKEQHKSWVHRLANLVPLNQRRNSSASNEDFSVKKDKYFRGNSNVSSYALTTQVLDVTEWTPEIVEERQKELLSALVKNWNLE